jgi:SAM-dependent methyltransferase
MSKLNLQTAAPASCCGPDCCGGDTKSQRPADELTAAVRDRYGVTAKGGLSSNDAGVRAVADAFGYTPDELEAIPAEANMGLSCGNPIALANLRAGEVVVDLGCGGGLDVFLASQKVGPTGKAIGIDMTPEMIALARRNAANGVGGKPYTNVEFHEGRIDALPLPDASADVIVSNCVINLVPDKRAVFSEMFRVLKPGGRVAVSDIALKRKLPAELGNDLMAYIGCVAGAIGIEDYRQGLADAGFEHVAIIDSGADLNAYGQIEGQGGCCSPTTSGSGCGTLTSASPDVHSGLAELLKQYDVNDYAASVKVYAVKP